MIPYSDGQGLRRISGNGQFGPAGRQLPFKLLVQLNDSNGNPMSCEPVTFAVERPGLVCFGVGGMFNASSTGDPEIRRVCNDIEGGSLVGGPTVYTDADGQAAVEYVLPDAVGTVAISATADNTGEKVFFVETSVARLSATLTLPPPGPTSSPALGPLDTTVGSDPTRSFMSNKNNYTLTIDALATSTGSTNNVPSAPLAAGGTLTITGTQFTDSEPASGGCGGAPQPGYPRVWIGGVEVTPSSVTNTQIVVPIPEGMPGAASVIVHDGTSTSFKDGSGCIPSRANARANLWRVTPGGQPVYLAAETGSLAGTSILMKVEALDSCGNVLPLGGRTVTVWAENPDGSTPSTAVQVSAPDTNGLVTVSAVGSGDARAAMIGADVDGTSTNDSEKGVVVAVPQLRPGNYTEDPALGNDDGVNSIVFRGGSESGGTTDTVHINPAFRLQTVDVTSYDMNWMCTVGIIPACECPAAGTALSAPCGDVFETEQHLSLATMTGEGDMKNLRIGTGDAAVGGSAILGVCGGYDNSSAIGGICTVVSAQVTYDVSITSGSQNVDGTVLTGTLKQSGGEQRLEALSNGIMLYDDRGDSNPGNDEIRQLVFRLIVRRAMP